MLNSTACEVVLCLWEINKSLIALFYWPKRMGYWPSGRSRWLDIGQDFFCMFMTRTELRAVNWWKKYRGQYPAILTKKAQSLKDILLCFWRILCSRDKASSPKMAELIYLQLLAWVSNHRCSIWPILSTQSFPYNVNYRP